MKKTIEVNNANTLIESIKQDEMFRTAEGAFGLNARYNGVFGLLANPKINIKKLSETSIKICISSNILLKLVAIFFTIFFWAIAIFAILKSKLNTSVIIATFILPSLLWILNLVFNSHTKKIIIEEIKRCDEQIN